MTAARRLLERAAAHPGRTAVEAAGAHQPALSYGRLAAEARDLAARLARRGARPGDTVALIASSTPGFVTALLALQAAGLVCSPLDDTQPPPGCAAPCGWPVPAWPWWCHRGGRTTGPASWARRRWSPPARTPRPPTPRHRRRATPGPPYPAVAVADDDPAYVLFTSGSTGTPKGVQIAHGAFARHCEAAREAYGLDETSVVLQFASPGFDVALEEIWPTLLAGGRVVLRGDGLWSLRDLLAVTRRHGVTMWQLPTAYWTLLTAEAETEAETPQGLVPPPSLRCVLTGGEAAAPATARRWLASPLGAVRLLNAYGPTEGVVTSTLYEVPREAGRLPGGEALPIGRALAGRRALVVDERLRPLPPGRRGELLVTGPCLADGYRGDPEGTGRAFVELPDGTRAFRTGDLATEGADGLLVYHGRSDRQVKISGVRVEPGEVEAALTECADVTAAAVTVHGEGSRSRLVAHVVLRSPPADPAGRSGALRAELGTRLPRRWCPRGWSSTSGCRAPPTTRSIFPPWPEPYGRAPHRR